MSKSNETVLVELTLQTQETVVCAFLDIEGAFDNTPHEVSTYVEFDSWQQEDNLTISSVT